LRPLSTQVGFDNDGRIGKLRAEIFCDLGFTANEPEHLIALNYIQNIYKVQNWEIKLATVITNTPTNTFMRAPGKFKFEFNFTQVLLIYLEIGRD